MLVEKYYHHTVFSIIIIKNQDKHYTGRACETGTGLFWELLRLWFAETGRLDWLTFATGFPLGGMVFTGGTFSSTSSS